MNIPGLAGGSRGVFLDSIARLGTSLSERSRRMRDFAAIEVMNDHGLRDLGLCARPRRPGPASRRF